MSALLLGLALALSPAHAQEAGAQAPPPAEDAGQGLSEPPMGAPLTDAREIDRVTAEVSTGLRCPVCQGLSVNDSPAEGARSMKARIRELVAMGYSQEQIEDYFVDRYGVWVLLAPPTDRGHIAIWLFPLGFVLLGGGGVVAMLRSRRGTPAQASAAAAFDEAEDDLQPYRNRILAELGLPAEKA